MPNRSDPPPDDDDFDPEAPVELPIDGILDLHPFRPQDVKQLLAEYLPACHEKGIYEVLIIHGKGTGALRKTVQSILSKHPLVIAQRPAEEKDGGWGATWASLKH